MAPSELANAEISVLRTPERQKNFLTPLRGWIILVLLSHGLRRGLHSAAASRLTTAAVIWPRFAAHDRACDLALIHGCLAFGAEIPIKG